MPSISMFYGIVIYMYANDHLPPHFHAKYQSFESSFTLDGSIIKGNLPTKQQRLVEAWAQIHEHELRANWEVVHGGDGPYRVEPLR